MTKLRKRMIEDLTIRNYSPKTIKAYISALAQYARYFGKSPDCLSLEHIRTYQLYLVQEKKASWTQCNHFVCALRFLNEVTLGRKWLIQHIPHPRQEKKLPVILSRKELSSLFRAVKNGKHRTVLMIMYGAGLRISEALGLIVEDVDSERMQLRIRQGKGKKDRYGVLSLSMLEVLRLYWKQYHPKHWLFPGKHTDQPLSPSSIQKACQRARFESGIKKPVTTHTLRHCFATHLLEAGVDLKTIQLLMGHTTLHTTSLYLHLAKSVLQARQGPLDLLGAVAHIEAGP